MLKEIKGKTREVQSQKGKITVQAFEKEILTVICLRKKSAAIEEKTRNLERGVCKGLASLLGNEFSCVEFSHDHIL